MADGVIAGRLEIPVEADTSTFAEQLKRKVEGIAGRIEAKVKAVIDGNRLREDLEAAVQAAADGVEARIKASFDTDGMREQLTAAVDAASAGVEAKVSALIDAGELRAELEVKAAEATAGFQLKLKATVEGIAGEVVKAEVEGQAAADTNPVDVPVKLGDKGLREKLLAIILGLKAEADAAPDVKVKTKVDTKPFKELAGLLKPGLFVGIASLIQPLIALLGQAAGAAGSLVSAISPALGVIGALPGAITTLVSVLGTAVIGFHGFTKAIQTYAQAQTKLKTAQQQLAQSQQGVTKSMAGLTPAQLAAVKNYGKLTSAQRSYSSQLSKLTPQERAAFNAVQRTNGAYTVTQKQITNLSQRMAALNPTQKQAVDQALALAAAHQKTGTVLKGLSPQQQQLVKDMRGLTTQQKAVVQAQAAVNKALDGLSPSAKTAALAIYGLKGAWTTTRKAIQESIFKGFAADIEPAATRTLPLLRTQLSKVGAQLGIVIDKALKFVQTPLFRAQFRAITDQAAHSVGILGGAGFNLATAFGNIAIASFPLQNRMLGLVTRFSDWAKAATSGVTAGARMRAFFKDAGDTAFQLGRILKDVGDGIFKIFSAGRGAGNTLLDGIERQAHRLADYMNSPKGFANVRSYFDGAVPGARALASLVGAIGKALGQLSRDNNLASMLDEIRTQLLPAVTGILDNFGRSLGPGLITAISEIIRLLGNLSTAASPLALLTTALAGLAAGINAVIEHVPGLGPAIGALLGFAAVTKVLILCSGAVKAVSLQMVLFGQAMKTSTAPVWIRPLVAGMQTLAGGLVARATTVMKAFGLSEVAAGTAAKVLVAGLGGIGLVVAGISLGNYLQDASKANVATDDLAKSLTNLGDKGKDSAFRDLFNTAGLGPFQVQAKSAKEAIDQFGDAASIAFGQGWSEKTQRMLSFGVASRQAEGQLQDLDKALAQLVQNGDTKDATAAFKQLTDRLHELGFTDAQITKIFPQYEEAVKGSAVATQKQADAAAAATAALSTMGGKLDASAKSANKMKTALDSVLGLFQSVPQAEASFADVLDNITGKIDKQTKAWVKNHGSIDVNSKSGRLLLGNLTDMISANANVANAILQTTGSQKKANDAWNAGRQKIIDHLTAMGLSKAEAQKLVDKYGGLKDAINNVPKLLKMRVSADGLAAASAALSALGTFTRKLNGSVVKIRVEQVGGLNQASFTSTDKNGHTTTRIARAFGGFVRGKGGPTDDANTVRLSSGEFVVRAARSKRFAALLQAINSGSDYAIQAAIGALASAGSAVHGIASRASGAVLPDVAAPRGARAAGGLRPAAGPVVVMQPPQVDAGRPANTVIVDADGRLIGTMRTAAQKTAAQRRAADRLGQLGTWGIPA